MKERNKTQRSLCQWAGYDLGIAKAEILGGNSTTGGEESDPPGGGGPPKNTIPPPIAG